MNIKKNELNRLKYLNSVHYNNSGEMMIITEYFDNGNVTVVFDGNVVVKGLRLQCVRNGRVKNPQSKSVLGIGIGGSSHCNNHDEKYKTCDSVWQSIFKRCYTERKSYDAYNGCIICEEWKSKNNFRKWWIENIYECDKTLSLDKDILIKNNKVYSPERCMIVPLRINVMFARKSKVRDLPIGVRYSGLNRFSSTLVTKENKNGIHLGNYKTPEEAFNAYKNAKEAYIKQVADEYKDKIPQKLYDAMYRYEVEIDD